MNARKPPPPMPNHYHNWYWRHYPYWDYPYDYYDDDNYYFDHEYGRGDYGNGMYQVIHQNAYQQGFAHGIKFAQAPIAKPAPKMPPVTPTPKSEGEE